MITNLIKYIKIDTNKYAILKNQILLINLEVVKKHTKNII